MELYMSPLSANAQCKTIQDAEILFKKLYESIHFCNEMIDAENLFVFYDPHLECRQIVEGQAFLHTIGNLNPDIKKLWLILKNNYSKILRVSNSDSIQVCVNSQVNGIIHSQVNGIIHSQLFGESKKWLGFICSQNLDRNLVVTYDSVNIGVINFFDIDHVKEVVPIYELNPKHRKNSYFSDLGEYISPMPISDSEAQGLLFASKSVPSSPDKWGYCRKTQKFYRFKRTHPGKEVYHGFLSRLEDVPDEIKRLYE